MNKLTRIIKLLITLTIHNNKILLFLSYFNHQIIHLFSTLNLLTDHKLNPQQITRSLPQYPINHIKIWIINIY